MDKGFKRFISFLMVLILSLSVWSFPAFAENQEALPSGFFDKVKFGSAIKGNGEDGNLEEFGANVSDSASCALWFHYVIPEDTTMARGTLYTFEIDTKISDDDGNTFVSKKVIDGDETICIKDENNVNVANVKFTEATGGKIKGVLTFLSTASDEALAGGREGCFFYEAKFDGANLPKGGKQQVRFDIPGTAVQTAPITVDFAAPKATAKVTISENANTSGVNLTNHEIEWKIKVTPNVENQPDSANEYINTLKVSIPISVGGSSYVTDSAMVTIQGGTPTNAGFSVKDGVLTFEATTDTGLKKAAWPLVITYKSSYKPEELTMEADGTVKFKGSAKVEITAPQYEKDANGKVSFVDSSAEKIQITASAITSAEPKILFAKLSKTGALISGRTAKWEVSATNGMLQANPHIVDTLPVHMTLVDNSVTLNGTSCSAADYTYDSSTRKLKVNLDSSIPVEQIITYETKFEGTPADLAGISTIKNNVEFNVGTGAPLKKTYSIDLGGALMTQSGTYDAKTHTITWTANLNTQGKGLSNVELGFIPSQKIGSSDVSQSYVEGSLKINNVVSTPDTVAADKKNFSVNIPNADGTYTIEYKTVLGDEDAARKFWGDNYNGEFSVQSCIRMTAAGLDTGSAKITTTVKGKSTVLVKKFIAYDYLNHQILWRITVNQNQMKLTNGTITDVLFGDDWVFDQSSVVVQQGGTALSGAVATFASIGSEKIMKVTVPDCESGSGEITVDYATKLAKLSVLQANTKLSAYNTAFFSALQTPPTEVRANCTASFGLNVLSKNSSSLNAANNRLTWTIDINKNLAVISASGIQDTLQQGLCFEEDSLKVYQLDITFAGKNAVVNTGAALTKDVDYKVIYNEVTRRLDVEILDGSGNTVDTISKSYRIVFDTTVLVSGSYSNSTNFTGTSTIPAEWQNSETSVVAKFSGGKTIPGLGKMIIKVVDGNDGSKTLSDVEFEIYKKCVSGDVLIGKFKTDSKGEITTVLKPADYKLKKVSTPSGYKESQYESEVKITNGCTKNQLVKEFKNKYVAGFTPIVTAEVQGPPNWPDSTFIYQLTPKTPGAPMPHTPTAKAIKSDMEARFGSMEYTQNGVYSYQIKQISATKAGFTYDFETYDLTVTVTTDGTGQKTATATYGPTNAASLKIINSYEVPGGIGGGGGSGGGGSSPITPEPKGDIIPIVTPTVEPIPEPVIPKYKIDKIPSPADPASPKKIVVTDGKGKIIGAYHIERQPDGSYVYIDEEGVPLGLLSLEMPMTDGLGLKLFFMTGGLLLLAGVSLRLKEN